MLTTDILGKEINIGDECIIADSGYTYKIRVVKETKLSMGYNIWHHAGIDGSYWIDKIFWTSKTARPFNNMYKI